MPKKLTTAKHKRKARAVVKMYKLKLAQHRKKLAQRKRSLLNYSLAANAILADSIILVKVDVQCEAVLEKCSDLKNSPLVLDYRE